MIGSTLSHFRITAKLGEGGMGEVYRAEDTKLGREVAIKVLPEAVANDPERLIRFEREARVLAALDHPNIAAIHGLEEADGRQLLVMELVEGETLAERIGHGRVPLDEALPLALQIAEALEAAHEKGIIHRDLKPANVKVTPQGQVKVLDFGLAKALEEERPQGDLANSPTLTAAATQAGIILGTAAYMSPEQAAGMPVDKRADIWAFGVVLAEMLTGRQQFQGKTVSHVLAAVLQSEPEWGEQAAGLPQPVVELLERCLRKEATQRLQAIGDARIVLEEYLADPEAWKRQGVEAVVAPVAAGPVWKRALPWALLGLAVAGLGVALWRLGRSDGTPQAPPSRFTVQTPVEGPLMRGYGASAVLSPDGGRIAYVFGTSDGDTEIYLLSFDQWEGIKIAGGSGQEGPYQPFFSPDGEWVGFVTLTELKKAPVAGGTPITLCKVNFSRGATWSEDGTIVFAADQSSGLSRVPDVGGEPQPLTQLDQGKGESTHRWPQALPGGRAVLFTSHTNATDFDAATLEVVSLSNGERKVIHQGGYYGRYVPSGHLVYINQGTIFAVAFDLDKLETHGTAVPMVEAVSTNPANGGAQFSVAADGRLAYLTGSATAEERGIFWVDREGVGSPLWSERRNYSEPAMSPDGGRIAISAEIDSNWDIWVLDLDRQVTTRLTFDPGEDVTPVWSPDGAWIAFSSQRDGTANLYRKAADGSGEAVRLTESTDSQYPGSWSTDGRLLAFMQQDSATLWDLWLLPLEEGGEPEPFLATPFVEVDPRIAPDGRWIAYASMESGRAEIYVRTLASDQGKWQVSSSQGTSPAWSADGGELFFRSSDGSIQVVQVETGAPTFRAGRPQTLFSGDYTHAGTITYYAVAPDGQHFVMFRGEEGEAEQNQDQVRIVLGWLDELEELVPGGAR